MTETPIISLKNIHKSFGSLEVLKGIDLFAKAGEVVVLIGSSGSGKSTLLRCANLLEICQQGDIRFDGDLIVWKGNGADRKPASAKQVIKLRSKLSMVFQQFNLWSHMSVLDNVIEGPVSVLGKDRTEAEAQGVLPLDDRTIELFGARFREHSPHRPDRHYTYYPPMTQLPAQTAPALGGRSWDMVARYVIPKINGMLDRYRESNKFVIENRGTWDRANDAVASKIRAHEGALAALEEDEAQGRTIIRGGQQLTPGVGNTGGEG